MAYIFAEARKSKCALGERVADYGADDIALLGRDQFIMFSNMISRS